MAWIILTKCLEKVVFEEITLWVRGMHRPEVVYCNIEDTQNEYQEGSRPFRFEPNGNHSTRGKTKYRNEETTDTPLPLDNETKEKEYE